MSTDGDVSRRVKRLFSFDFKLKNIFLMVGENGYSESTNIKGIINMTTAHNARITEIIIEKLNQLEHQAWKPSDLPYPQERHGISRLRGAMADFLSEQLSTPEQLDPNKMIIANGVTSLLSMMAFTLCDEGDAILTPSPMYGAVPRDFLFQAGVRTLPVFLSSKPGLKGREPYEMTVEMLESALEDATRKGHKVRALFLVNPFNPLGIVYTKEQVLSYLEFCKKHDLHCFIDEIYVCSIYDSSIENSSVLSIHPDHLPDQNKTHVIWGFSKDFGMPGSPIGVVYTWNADVLNGLKCLADFQQVPHFIQRAAAKLLEDKEWVQSVHGIINKKGLAESAQITMAALDELRVPYIKPSGGLFIWADFRKYLQTSSMDGERELTARFLEWGVAIAPAEAFYYNEYGWFRIIFSVPRQQLIEGLKRIKAACASLLTPGAEAGLQA